MEFTKTVKDKTFDDYFTEVDHSESISDDRPGSMRLFYLNIRSGKIKISDLEKFTMLNIGPFGMTGHEFDPFVINLKRLP